MPILAVTEYLEGLQMRNRLRRSAWQAVGGAAIAVVLISASGTSEVHPQLTSSVQSMKQEASALTQRIAALDAQVQSISSHYAAVEGQIKELQGKESAVEATIAQKRQQLKKLHGEIVSEAVSLFAQAGTDSQVLSVLQDNPNSSAVAQEDITTASSTQEQAVNAYQAVQQELTNQESQLQADQSQQASLLSLLSTQEAKAQTAQQQASSELSSVNSQIQQMVAAQLAAQEQARQAQIEAQQIAAEQAAAAQAAAAQAAAAQQAALQQAAGQAQGASGATPSGGSTPVAPSQAVVAPSGYANPIRAIGDLQVWRVDQGVDYNGYGPIYAIGDGVVLSTFNGGWPGGTFITYRLTNGPAAGLVVYAAEDINPDVSVGQSVTPNTVLGTLYNGPDGIETGWADGGALGETMAMSYGQFYGSNSTAFGYNFSQLLASLGAPAGVMQNSPTGSVPGNWPQW